MQRAAIAGNQLFAIENQHAFTGGAQKVGGSMEADDRHLLESAIEEAVLDLLHCETDQTHGMGMLGRGMARHVEHAGEFPIGIENGACGTMENAMGLEEVLAAMYFDGTTFGQRRANGICSGRHFGPGDARAQGNLSGATGKFGAAGGVENQALGIGEDDDAIGQLCFEAQRYEFGAREQTQGFVLLLKSPQFRRGHRFGQDGAAGIESLFGAALPRTQDGCGHQPFGQSRS